MYVDCLMDRAKDRIHVVERVNGQRIYREFPAEYVMYYDDAKGKFRTIFDTPVSRYSTHHHKDFQKEIHMHHGKQIWESDINPIFRCLATNYLGADSPKLQTAFFDIETDFSKDRGWARPDDPFNPITAISVYLDWMDKLVTLVIPPKSYTWETAKEICDQFENCYLFEREEDMLENFLDLIEDADVLSGWNSEGFDIPYTVMRITRILSKDDTRRFCLWGQLPRPRTYNRFGSDELTFDLSGRVHLDYMQLYRKYTYEERHSYSLDSIGEYEDVGHKVSYDGTLDQLYNFDFPKFIDYNRQDVLLLAKLDKKLRFMDIANELAHANTVLLQTTMGAVAVTEQAIINEAHSRGMIVPNRVHGKSGNTQAAGAYVMTPKKGMHEYIGVIDINSLYPSAIRALNMGPDTIVGQLRPTMTDPYIKAKTDAGASFAEAWDGLFGSLEYTAVMEQQNVQIIVDWEDGTSSEHSATQVWNMLFTSGQPWSISANGTIFRHDIKGIVPGLLERWYSERKEMQAKKKEAKTPEDQAFWDKRQLVRKINLNSLYGAILNPGCRFQDHRVGQSTTLTGRIIARHMDAYVNEAITGVYDHNGDAIIYGDTDSCIFSAWPVLRKDVESGDTTWSREICITIYDAIADRVNDSFPGFMERACHVPRDLGSLIRAGRELVGSKGIFVTKKRYAILIYELEGKRYDLGNSPGKLKAMGLDLKRADTPKIMQDFLVEILIDVLTGADQEPVIEKIKTFKLMFTEMNPWEKGTPKRVNNLTKFTNAEKAQGRANMPGHVRAALNWNNMREMVGDNQSIKIVDGMKTVFCKLKDNPMGLTSMAYPIDQLNIPQWYKDLPFDDSEMEATIVDHKVENLLGVLGWDITAKVNIRSKFNDLFTWE